MRYTVGNRIYTVRTVSADANKERYRTEAAICDEMINQGWFVATTISAITGAFLVFYREQ